MSQSKQGLRIQEQNIHIYTSIAIIFPILYNTKDIYENIQTTPTKLVILESNRSRSEKFTNFRAKFSAKSLSYRRWKNGELTRVRGSTRKKATTTAPITREHFRVCVSGAWKEPEAGILVYRVER